MSMSDTNALNAVKLLPGVTIGGIRQASQINGANQLEGGYTVTFRIPSGATGSVFIATRLLGNTAAIQDAINTHASQLMAIEALSNPTS